MPTNRVVPLVRKAEAERRWRVLVRRWAAGVSKYTLLISVLLISVMPFFWTWTTALRTSKDFMRGPFTLPKEIYWGNLPQAWTVGHFGLYWKNSLIISVPTTLAVLAVCTLGGYALARLEFPGRNVIFYIFLMGLMIPFETIMIPLYYELNAMKILATPAAAILPMIALGLPFGLFMMRAFFLSLPYELSDAARVDGCGELGVFWRVMLPLTTPAVSTLGVFQFMWSWNALLIPLVYVQREEFRPLTVGLLMFQDRWGRDYGLTAAGVTITSLPVIIVFIIFQRQFIRGLSAGALKG